MITSQFNSFVSGALHPIYGFDHILAMVVVGVWAMQMGGRGKVFLPVGFVTAMALGFVMARAALPLPLIEPVIVASSIIVGLFVLLALTPPLPVAVAFTAGFGLFHGYAHGGEMGTATPLAFGIGFISVTAVLHGLGLLMAGSMQHLHRVTPRILGGVSAALGLSLLLS
ncbi:urease accessory protein [Pacificibacter maritimus]|uniref:Urease accessory protein n=1 Tax=Pacificibacter maritimus TaxID=762213 RepID=A0A3N4VFJ4_9RHOB|nr:HupE/UreJ family protein [Pacificibacter maritimus]RPE71694.1 urease accessory protein [Pacificibacter maritimus]